MADFIDSEAEESEEEQELNDTERKKLKKLKAIDSDDEEDEEDDEERIREELKDLIDDNPIEEEESDDGGDSDTGSKKRKKSYDEDELDDRLEDDDYELLEENLGVKMERRKHFKRLRRIQDEESDDEQTEQNEGDDRDAIRNELFGHSDNLEGEDMEEDRSSDRGTQQRGEMERYDEEGSEEEYSDADDFIVDDEGRPIAEKRKRRKPIFTDAALQEAQDIFGVDFDYDEFGKYDEYEEESEEEEDEYIDEEEGEGEEGRRRRQKKTARKKPSRKSIFEIYEPSELKRGHFTDVDNEIRTTDVPERMQLRSVPVTKVSKDLPELEEEAEWIYKQAFCRPTISTQEGFGSADTRERVKKGPQTVGKIKQALDFMRNEHFEVPFIAFYRKEYVQPELNVNDLWKVYKYDEKWCQLQSRKTNLTRLFEKMRDYQAEELMKTMDQPIADSVRVMKDEDIDRLKKVQTMEELRDIYQHFMLYYAHELPAMQEAWRRREREEAKERKRQERLARRAERGENEDGGEDEDVIEEDPPEEDEDEIQQENETLKQASRGGTYALCRKAGLDGLAKRFGLTPEQFAENLRDNYQRHEVEQEPSEPSVVADEYKSNIFKTTDDVMMAAKYMVAIQLSREPLVRSCMRETYFERAKLNIKPTKKGIKEIDENHPCYSMKYVKNKPVRDLMADQFLKLHMAEQERLITITISEDLEGMTSSSYMEEIRQLYHKDEFSKSVQEWNNLRSESVELAMKKLLLPSLRTELRDRLLSEARDNVLRTCCQKLYNWLKVAPYAVEFADEDEDDWDTSKGLRVLSIAYVPDFSQAAFACVVGPEGDCMEFIRLPNLMKRKNGWREEDKLQKEADLLALRHLITSKRPHVVCIGSESREATMVQADLREIVSQVVEDEQFPSIAVEICDNELAKVYANSIKGSNDFRDFPHLLRQAVSLARRMQDPLIEFSQLCTPDEEILCLRFHPLQEQLQKEELLEALYLEFVNRTNEVGVDLNRAVQEPNTSNLVQFVCGLGARKATALMKTLKQTNQRLENRTQLVTLCHMAPVVFINCAGFIKIDTNSLGDSTEAYVEVLDGSRVHPETYEWARKMAVDALEYDDEDANPAGALEEILESPERLKDLDLDAFAEELERQNFGNRSITLYDIRSELTSRYKDLRIPYQSPNPEELFDMLTKESPETFFIGKLIMATVVGITHRKPQGEQLDQANPLRNDETNLWQCPFCLKNDFPELSEVWNHFDAGGCPGQATGVRLRLDNGISGYIPIKNLSDNHVTNPEERVRIGQIIHCRVCKIEVDRFSVECTSRSSDLVDKNGTWRPQKDPFYDAEAEENDLRSEEETKKLKQRQTYIKRVIVHPSFHNISYSEAEKMMANMDQGDVIVRPSSKGSDHLTVTWKVTDGIYQHIDVREEGKENAFSLGQSLWIDNLEFEDLDEIIARHVTPMAAFVRDILAFKYIRDFDGGKREKAEATLMEEREKNKNKIHYFISPSKEFPGKFLLSYMPRTRTRHEYITVTPEGFRYRRQMFDTLNSLMRWFKEHFRDPLPGTPSTPRGSVTNRTPFANHTPTMNMSGMNAEAIHRVAQSMPSHMLHSLSQVANQTPHYPHTPGGPGFTGAAGYAFANTPYTPSGQTPYMTPYQTPHTQQTPRYGQQTPSHSGGFLHPGAVTPSHRTPSSHSRPSSQQGSVSSRTHSSTPTHGTPTYRSSGPSSSNDPTHWQKAAEEWAKASASKMKQREPGWGTPRSDGRSTPRGTPRYDDIRGTPHSYDGRSSRGPMDMRSPRIGTPRMGTGTPRLGTPRSSAGSIRSTPRTNTSPHSMVESSLGGDATPLYDEN